MARYKITYTVTTDSKAPRRGARELLRYRLLKLLASQGVSLAALRSLKVRRVA